MNKSKKIMLLFFMFFAWANSEQIPQSSQESSDIDVKSAWEKVLENNDALNPNLVCRHWRKYPYCLAHCAPAEVSSEQNHYLRARKSQGAGD